YHHVHHSILPPCHTLHYLQMSTEKLAKAALMAGGMKPDEIGNSHLAFSKFLHLAFRNRNLRLEMGMSGAQLRMHFAHLLPLADAIERLAPALSRGGINPEYPWEEPNGIVHTPAIYQFKLAQDLSTPKGVNLLKDIGLMLKNFEKLFG
ncbi:MAG: hypothetical protein AAB354_14900, partial [candidate division KSB1 bacterium]